LVVPDRASARRHKRWECGNSSPRPAWPLALSRRSLRYRTGVRSVCLRVLVPVGLFGVTTLALVIENARLDAHHEALAIRGAHAIAPGRTDERPITRGGDVTPGALQVWPKCRWMASLASRCFAGTITQREDVTVSGQSARAATGQILLSPTLRPTRQRKQPGRAAGQRAARRPSAGSLGRVRTRPSSPTRRDRRIGRSPRSIHRHPRTAL
jgi:hypothetical protein